MEKLKNYLPIISFAFIFLLFVKSCGTSSDLNKLKKQNELLIEENKNLKQTIVKKEDVDIIVEDYMWKFLQYEEMSDKNNIPINSLKNQYEKNRK